MKNAPTLSLPCGNPGTATDIQAMDEVVPGFASTETLLYSPELKFYSNRVKMDERFRTNMEGLHCLGDSSGWTRGLMMASVMGVLMGRVLTGEEIRGNFEDKKHCAGSATARGIIREITLL